MSVTTRIKVADPLAATYEFVIEHEGRELTMGPADAHELAVQMEVRLRELTAQLKVAERTEAGRLDKVAAPHPDAAGKAPDGNAPSGGAPAHGPGGGQQ